MSSQNSAWLSVLEFLYWSGVVLVISGVVLEGAEIWQRRKHLFGRRQTVNEPWIAPPEHSDKWVHKWGDLGWLMLVLGLLLELVCGFKIDRIKTAEIGVLTDRLAVATTNAAGAIKQAGEARLLAALTESNNLILRSNVVSLEVEIIKIKAPRTISKDERERFISESKKWPKGAVKLGVRNPDIETSNYNEDVANLIRDAGYTITSAINYPTQITGGLKDNSTILIIFDSPETAPLHGQGILNSFNESRISVALERTNKISKEKFDISAGEVMIFVLEKRPGWYK